MMQLFEVAADDALEALAAIGGGDCRRALAGRGDNTVRVNRAHAGIAGAPREPLNAVSIRVLEGNLEVFAEERHRHV